MWVKERGRAYRAREGSVRMCFVSSIAVNHYRRLKQQVTAKIYLADLFILECFMQKSEQIILHNPQYGRLKASRALRRGRKNNKLSTNLHQD